MILTIIIGVFSSCDHANPDDEAYLLNKTSEKISVEEFRNGELANKILSLNINEPHFYCPCGGKLSGDSIVFKKIGGDSIVYHNPRVTNSNFEKTKTRSPYAEEPWDEFDKNQFQYTILPEDFQ